MIGDSELPAVPVQLMETPSLWKPLFFLKRKLSENSILPSLPLPSFVDKSPTACDKRTSPPTRSWWTLYFEANKLFSFPRLPPVVVAAAATGFFFLSFLCFAEQTGLSPWTVMHASRTRHAGFSPCVAVCCSVSEAQWASTLQVPGIAFMTSEQTYSYCHTMNDTERYKHRHYCEMILDHCWGSCSLCFVVSATVSISIYGHQVYLVW